jgi:TPR repeat protein
MARSNEFMAAMMAYDDDRETEALKLMEACAARGDPVACYLTAFWYRNGEGTRPNLKKCEEWLNELIRLAEADDAEAQWELSSKYRWGNLFTADQASANHWLERAAENGWGEAQHHLAWYFETGQHGYAVDLQVAEEWYRRAFEQGHPETLYTFALREFQDGKITEKAIALLTQAAEKGLQQAAHVLREHRH